MVRYFKIAENSMAPCAELPSRKEILAALNHSKFASARWNAFVMFVKDVRFTRNDRTAGAKTIEAVCTIFDICKLLGIKRLTMWDIIHVGDYLKIGSYLEYSWAAWGFNSVKSSVQTLRKQGMVESLIWIYTKKDGYLSREMSYSSRAYNTHKQIDMKDETIWDNEGIAQNQRDMIQNMIQADKKKKSKSKTVAAAKVQLTLTLDTEELKTVVDFLKSKNIL